MRAQARSEEVLLLAVLRWFDHAPSMRRAALLQMAELLRWPFIPVSTVATLEQARSYCSMQCTVLCIV